MKKKRNDPEYWVKVWYDGLPSEKQDAYNRSDQIFHTQHVYYDLDDARDFVEAFHSPLVWRQYKRFQDIGAEYAYYDTWCAFVDPQDRSGRALAQISKVIQDRPVSAVEAKSFCRRWLSKLMRR